MDSQEFEETSTFPEVAFPVDPETLHQDQQSARDLAEKYTTYDPPLIRVHPLAK
jgi:hypothetical protein